MPHISYSELKNWVTCPFYHKITYLDGIRLFKGNEHTSFGTAIHETGEKMILEETENPVEYFNETFQRELAALTGVSLDEKLVTDMYRQGPELLPLMLPALKEHFGEFTYVAIEEDLYQDIEEFEDYKFKGFIDLVIKTSDGKYHIIDWKTCSWGWDSRRKTEKMTTYQLALYKYFWSKKHAVSLDNIETHFALLKRTAKKNKVEIFRVPCGAKKIDNAIKLLTKALYNISKENFMKNKLACQGKWGPCEFYKSEHCP